MQKRFQRIPFLRDTGGNFAILFGLVSMVVFLAAGLAVDYSRALAIKSRVNNALDAATLATGRAVMIDEISTTGDDAKNYFKAVFAANMGDDTFDDTVYTLESFTLDAIAETVSAQVSVDQKLTLTRVGTAKTSQKIASHSKIGYGVGSIEVAMVLDVTGSMVDPSSKLAALKQAAKLAIQELLASNTPTNVNTRVSLVPYSEGVNAGPLAKYVYPDYNEAKSDAPVYDPSFTAGYDVAAFQKPYLTQDPDEDVKCRKWRKKKKKYKYKWKSEIAAKNVHKWECPDPPYRLPSDFLVNDDGTNVDDCATDRKAPKTAGPSYQYTDANPGSGMISRDSRLWYEDCPNKPLAVLSSDKAKLNAVINGLTGYGWTAGHVGLQWAWYTISNKWADYIDGTDSDPGDMGTDPLLRKFIILMTDGEFNTAYAGTDDSDVNDDEAALSTTHTENLCTNIKAQGIKIFTIGFKTPDAADTMLKACASPKDQLFTYSYEPDTAQELKETYKKIARMIRILRLTQ